MKVKQSQFHFLPKSRVPMPREKARSGWVWDRIKWVVTSALRHSLSPAPFGAF